MKQWCDNAAYVEQGKQQGIAQTKVGTASAGNVLEGKTFTNSTSVGITGTMVNHGTLNWNPTSNTTQTVQPGYYSGGTLNSAGAYNKGKTDGATQTKVGTAVAANVLSGKTFTSTAGVGLTGSMVNRGTLNWNPNSSTTQTVEPGYYSGGTLSSTGAYTSGYNAAKTEMQTENYKKIIDLGTGTLFNVSTYEGYRNFNSNNFLLVIVGMNTRNTSTIDDRDNGNTTINLNPKVEYNATSGIVRITGLSGEGKCKDYGNTGYNVNATLTVKLYLLL